MLWSKFWNSVSDLVLLVERLLPTSEIRDSFNFICSQLYWNDENKNEKEAENGPFKNDWSPDSTMRLKKSFYTSVFCSSVRSLF